MHKLEGILPAVKGGSVTHVNNADCVIYDGHATIQALNPPPLGQPATFRDMVDNFTTHVIRHSDSVCQTSHQLHVVFDECKQDSIEAQTREELFQRHMCIM